MGRPNLSVLVEVYVTRLLLDDDSDEPVSAKGVEFKYGDNVYVAYSNQEILLCAGSVHESSPRLIYWPFSTGSALKSPQILELSGIGDPEILTPLGIDVKVDLPGVGANLQEHFVNPSIVFGKYMLVPPLYSNNFILQF